MQRITLPLAAIALLLTACGDGLAGPGDSVLVGQYGKSDQQAELLATRAGIELDLACGSYFASAQPAVLSADGSFLVHGSHHFGGFSNLGASDATLSGRTGIRGAVPTVTITLTFDGSPVTDPFTVTLARGVVFTGVYPPCPA